MWARDRPPLSSGLWAPNVQSGLVGRRSQCNQSRIPRIPKKLETGNSPDSGLKSQINSLTLTMLFVTLQCCLRVEIEDLPTMKTVVLPLVLVSLSQNGYGSGAVLDEGKRKLGSIKFKKIKYFTRGERCAE